MKKQSAFKDKWSRQFVKIWIVYFWRKYQLQYFKHWHLSHTYHMEWKLRPILNRPFSDELKQDRDNIQDKITLIRCFYVDYVFYVDSVFFINHWILWAYSGSSDRQAWEVTLLCYIFGCSRLSSHCLTLPKNGDLTSYAPQRDWL